MPGPPVAIYALIVQGNIRYVGQTDNPEVRKQQWCNPRNRQRIDKKLRRFRFQVLRFASSEHALRIESQIIRACKRRGFADLNKIQDSTSDGKLISLKRAFFWVRKRAIFLTSNHVAYHFNISMATVSLSQRKYDGWTADFNKAGLRNEKLVKLTKSALRRYWPKLKICILIALHGMRLTQSPKITVD